MMSKNWTLRLLNIWTFLLIAWIPLACNENRVFEEHEDPSGNLEWTKDQHVRFSVDIENIKLNYNVIAAIRYAHGFAFKNLPVRIKRINPDGSEEIKEYTFNLRNDDGSNNGEGAGDIWDYEELIQEGITFPEKGTYNYEISHIMRDRDLIHMVMEVGLIIDKIPANPQ